MLVREIAEETAVELPAKTLPQGPTNSSASTHCVFVQHSIFVSATPSTILRVYRASGLDVSARDGTSVSSVYSCASIPRQPTRMRHWWN